MTSLIKCEAVLAVAPLSEIIRVILNFIALGGLLALLLGLVLIFMRHANSGMPNPQTTQWNLADLISLAALIQFSLTPIIYASTEYFIGITLSAAFIIASLVYWWLSVRYLERARIFGGLRRISFILLYIPSCILLLMFSLAYIIGALIDVWSGLVRWCAIDGLQDVGVGSIPLSTAIFRLVIVTGSTGIGIWTLKLIHRRLILVQRKA